MSGNYAQVEISFESLLVELKQNTSHGYHRLLSDTRPYESDIELAGAIGDVVFSIDSRLTVLRTICTLLGMIEWRVQYDKDCIQEL